MMFKTRLVNVLWVMCLAVSVSTIPMEEQGDGEPSQAAYTSQIGVDAAIDDALPKLSSTVHDDTDDHIKEPLKIVTTKDGDEVTVTSVAKMSTRRVQGICRPTDLCRQVYQNVNRNLGPRVSGIITTLAILPPVTYRVIFDMALRGSGVWIEAFMECWSCNIRRVFGSDPTAAAVRVEGYISGDIFFAQTMQREGKPPSISVVGVFEGLVPQQRYRVTVHKSGDIDDKCAYVGEEFSQLGGAFFTADDKGKATLMMQDTSVLIDGDASVLGRSVVVTPDNDTSKKSCGVVIRNLVPKERLRI